MTKTQAVNPVIEPTSDELDVHRTMDDAPRDGRWIEVTEDGVRWVRARWYKTAMRKPGSVPWVHVTCWSTSEPSKYASRVEKPIAWREDRGPVG